MRRNQKRKKSQGFWTVTFYRLPLVAGVILGSLFLGYLYLSDKGLPLYLDMVQKENALKRQTLQLQESNLALRESIDRLEHDPSKLEQLARDQLGMVRDGEVVYQFVEPNLENSGPSP